KLRQSLNVAKDLVKVIKPIGLNDRAQRYLRRVAYDCETPCSFKFVDDKFIESTPAQLDGIFCMQRIGSRKGQKLLKYFSHRDLIDNVIYNKFFNDIKSTTHQTTMTKKNIIEKIKQLMNDINATKRRRKVDEKNLILFVEHTPEGLIQKFVNHEQDIPRIG
ncbi:hypothetical protein C5167_042200, partial [Papaver somniferum]